MDKKNTTIHDRDKVNEIAKAFATSIEIATKNIGFDFRCIDWCTYNTDFHIKKQEIKAA